MLPQAIHTVACSGCIMFFTLSILMSVTCQRKLTHKVSHAGCRPTVMAIDQHGVCVDKSILLPKWPHPQAGESIPIQKWNSPQDGQMLLWGHHMTMGGRGLSVVLTV